MLPKLLVQICTLDGAIQEGLGGIHCSTRVAGWLHLGNIGLLRVEACMHQRL